MGTTVTNNRVNYKLQNSCGFILVPQSHRRKVSDIRNVNTNHLESLVSEAAVNFHNCVTSDKFT